MKILISTAKNKSMLSFENMNCLTEKDIKFFGLILFDHSIDTGENDAFNFNFYPNRKSSEIKQKFKKIEVMHKFMKTLTKNLVKDRVSMNIYNSVLEDADFIYLWRTKIWKEIEFVNCLIRNTIKKIRKWHLNQIFLFDGCSFGDGWSAEKEERDFYIKVCKMTTDIGHFNQIYSFYGSSYNHLRNIFDEVWITGKTRSILILNLLNLILHILRDVFIQV